MPPWSARSGRLGRAVRLSSAYYDANLRWLPKANPGLSRFTVLSWVDERGGVQGQEKAK